MSAAEDSELSAPDGLPAPQRYVAIAAVVLGVTMAALDNAIVGVALPTIARDLGGTPATSIWILNAYQIAVVVSLLPLAVLGERIGFRRVSQAGLCLFLAASVACILSTSLTMLSVSRMVQGFGAAGIMSVNPALARFTYPKRLLGRAVGLITIMAALASAIGPALGGAILSGANWRWVFFVNIPIGLVALGLALFTLPRNPLGKRRIDLVGVLLNAAAFGLTIVGIQVFVEAGKAGFAAAAIGVGLIAGYLLVRRELTQDPPLIPIDLLRHGVIATAGAVSASAFMAQTLAVVSLPFHFQDNLSYSPVETGLLMTPFALSAGVSAQVGGWLSDRYRAGRIAGGGLVILAMGLLLLAQMPDSTSFAGIVARMVVTGVGFGLFQAPNSRIILAASPRARAGGAGGVSSMARVIGQAVGSAVITIVFSLFMATGVKVALVLAALIALLAAGASILRSASSATE